MPVEVRELTSFLPHREIGLDEARIIARAWQEQSLRMGETLWEQGDPGRALALLQAGRLSVLVEGEEIGAVLPGDLIGEASAFSSGATRSATLQASEATRVLLLSDHELPRLCSAFPVFHERLLDAGLAALARRIRATDLRIARLSQGVLPAPSERAESGLARLWRTLTGPRSSVQPPLLPLLRRHPALAQQADPVLEALAAGFEAHAFERGELLIREGEPGDSAFLLAAGEVRVLRHVRHRMADLLATFEPGGLFGCVTLAVPGPRTATCQAASAGWLYRLDRAHHEALTGRARLAWRECMVRTLGLQLRNANALLAGFQAGTHQGGPLPDEQLQRLLSAAGALQGVVT